MSLMLYPIILIVAVIIFYILGKKNGTEKEVIKTVTQYTGQQTSNYNDETEEQYYLRCHNFISDCLTKKEVRYHASNDYKSFLLTFEDRDDSTYALNFEAYYNGGNSYIMFYTKILERVPDNKLVETSELINRLNNALILSSLQLDYENRTVESILIYPNAGQPLKEDYFHFYFTSLIASRQTLYAFNKVIKHDAEPALVTLEYMVL